MNNTLHDLYMARVGAGIIDADPAQLALIPRLEQIRKAVLSQASPQNLLSLFSMRKRPATTLGFYLWGEVGRGKSMLMDLLVATIPKKGTRRLHFHSFLLELHAAVHAAQLRGSSAPIDDAVRETAAGLAVLALDEMDVSDIADAMILDRVFRRLFEQGTYVLTTSNRAPSDLYRSGLKRELFLPFITLLEDHLDVLNLDASRDWRGEGLEGERVYFQPLSIETSAEFDGFWRRLVGDRAKPLRIKVLGRELVLTAHENGIARIRFADLCEQHLGPADFMALAKTIRFLFLDDVPVLGESRLNEARRFVMLVDAIYEAKGVIIVRAEAPAQELFHPVLASEGTLRLQSRLAEMSRSRWLENNNMRV